MNYVTIADLKKMAKKERKNNNNIKNHAESLNIIAEKYNYKSWTELLDSTMIALDNKKNEDEKRLFRDNIGNIYTYSESNKEYFHDVNSKISIIKNNNSEKESSEQIIINVIEQFNKEISYFYNLLKYDEEEELYAYISKNFLSSINEDHYSIWPNKARILCRVVCYVFRKSEKKKNFNNFFELFSLENLLKEISDNNLSLDHRVIDFLETINYKEKIDKNKKINITEEHLNQNGYLTMQMTCSLQVWKSAFYSFSEFNSNINTIKKIIEGNKDILFSLGLAKKHINPKNIAFYEYNLMLEKNIEIIRDSSTLEKVLDYFKEALKLEKEKRDILSNVVDNIIIKLHEIKSTFRINNPEVLRIYINNNFLNDFDSNRESKWASRGKELMEAICFVYTKSDLERNIYNFKEVLPFPNCLAIIEEKKLLNDIKVKRLFELVMYEYKPNEPIPNDVLEQYGFLVMQYSTQFNFIDYIMNLLEKTLDPTKKQIKDMIIKNYKNILLDTYKSSDINMLDSAKLFLKYRNSFNTEAEFLLDLKRNLV